MCIRDRWNIFSDVIKKAGRPITTIVERTGNNANGLAPIIADIDKGKIVMQEALDSLTSTKNFHELRA